MRRNLQNLASILAFGGLCLPIASGQGLIINEFTNGSATTQEFIEMLVIGSDANPNGVVDLSGWIIDDNNGEFEGGTGTGVATGHLRIAPGCFTNVLVGSMLVLYNAADPHPDLPPDDPYDANGDGVYVIPHTDPCIQVCTALPLASDPSYAPCTYGPATIGTWGNIGFRNNGDAVQVRRPDGTFYHGFAYGDISAPFPTFPAELGGGSAFNIATGAGTDRGYVYSCGMLNLVGNYAKIIDSVAASPGRANDFNNNGLWHVLRAGEFNYSDFADPDNCPITFPLRLVSFEAAGKESYNLLEWKITNIEPNSVVYVQRSVDAMRFEQIARIDLAEEQEFYNYVDMGAGDLVYYRLEMEEPSLRNFYSEIRAVSRENKGGVRLFPNPAKDKIQVLLPYTESVRYEIVGVLGQVSARGEILGGGAEISTAGLAAGVYYLRMYGGGFHYVKEFEVR